MSGSSVTSAGPGKADDVGSHPLIFFVNGVKVLDYEYNLQWSLADYLRRKLHLTGTKIGCNEGGCGACTVMVSYLESSTTQGKADKDDVNHDQGIIQTPSSQANEDSQSSRLQPWSYPIRHIAVNACLVPLPWIHGQAVTTVEGIGSTFNNSLHAVQKRIAECHGTQCGFCTPGFVMSMYALLRNNGKPGFEEMEKAFQGNLCRCTGYRPILEGFMAFTSSGEGGNEAGMDGCCGNPGRCCKQKPSAAEDEDEASSLIPPLADFVPFDETQEPIFPAELLVNRAEFQKSTKFQHNNRITWYQPATLGEVLQLKETFPDSKLVGGNTEIGVDVRQRGESRSKYISTRLVPELKSVRFDEETGMLSIGGAVTLSDLEGSLKDVIKNNPDFDQNLTVPRAILEMLSWFSGTQIRNVATLAGNIATSSPISDMNPLLAAVGAKLVLVSEGSAEKVIPMDATFFTGYRSNPIASNEVIQEIVIPLLAGPSSVDDKSFVRGYKVARRRDDDIAIVNAGIRVTLDAASSIVKEAQFWFGGATASTIGAEKAAGVAVRKPWNEDLLHKVLHALREDVKIPEEAPGGKASYRQTMVASFFFKFWNEVAQELARGSISNSSGISCTPVPSEGHSQGISPAAKEDFGVVDPIERPGNLRASQVYQLVPDGQKEIDPVGRPVPHLSAFEQATGEAKFLDDIPHYENELHLAPVLSTRAKARISRIDFSAAMAMPGVKAVLTEDDLGEERNCLGLGEKDERIFHSKEVTACGQVIAVVVATSPEVAREAARSSVRVHYNEPAGLDEMPILTIHEAIARKSYFYQNELVHGNVVSALAAAPYMVEGEAKVGGQEHFYLEPQATLAVPKGEKGEMEIYTTTQWPSLVQEQVSEMLSIPSNRIVVKVKRVGGAFGGKEIRNFIPALPTVFAAHKLKTPVRCVLTRQEDMRTTGQRHGYLGRYKVGFDRDGNLLAADLELYQNAGYSFDVSIALIQNSMLVCTNSYKIPAVRVKAYCCKTNLSSNTAMRAAGVLQPLMICEQFVQRVAEALDLNPADIRYNNLLKDGDVTHFGTSLQHCTIRRCWDECSKQADYGKRVKEVEEFNRSNKWRKRGIAMVPVKFNLGFPAHLNQAAALVMIYKDGSVLVSHAGVELGQGVQTKLAQIASRVLGVPLDRIHTAETATDKIPNATSSAASFTTDLNGPAVLEACETLFKRLEPYKTAIPKGAFKDWVQAAYMDRVSLSATGYHKTPGQGFNWETKTGNPTNYSSYGVGCSEVEIDCLTGEHKIIKTDIVMDIGSSLNPGIDVGQIEGAFVQGYGLWTMEDLEFAPNGSLRTVGPSNYKIPSAMDIPRDFRVTLLKGSGNQHAIYSSKGVGEPPMFLSSSVFFAIREAIRSARKDHDLPDYFQLDSPATIDKIRMACGDWLVKNAKKGDNAVPWKLDVQ